MCTNIKRKPLNSALGTRVTVNLGSLFKRKKPQQPPPKPLRDKLNEVTMRLTLISERIKQRQNQYSARSKELFDACVKALMSSEKDKAIVYANELSNMRKTMSTVMKSQFSIEGLVNRLQTINDVSELREVILPIKGVLDELRGQLSGILPNASKSIREVEEAVEDAIYGIGTVSDTIVEPSVSDEEVKKILMEASEVAAQRLKNEKMEDLNEALSYR